MACTKRRAIVSQLGELLAVFIVIGIVWGMLYFGMIQPMLNSTPNYPGVFPSTMVTLMTTLTGGYLAFVTILGILYLWQASRERGYYQ